MYYDALRRRVTAYKAVRDARNRAKVPVTELMAPAYLDLHQDVLEGGHTIYNLPGGRGGCKSSFVSLEIVSGVMADREANAIVFRRVGATMRDSVYSQIAWAIDELGASALWRGSVSPMQYVYIPTGQTIMFRGLDDPQKVKSIKPGHGRFKYVWFEEFSELTGPNMLRSVLQSVMRGGEGFRIFNSFNPPMSVSNWANKYVTMPDDRAITFRTTYLDVPREWLGEDFFLEADHLKEINEIAYRHEYLGEATGTGGQVFPNIETREITDEEADGFEFLYQGLDFGFSVDPFAFVRLAYDAKHQTIYFLAELTGKNKSNRQIADLIKEHGYDVQPGAGYVSMFDRMAGRRPPTAPPPDGQREVICDCAEPKSIADLQELGIRARPCTKFPGAVAYRIRWLQSKRIVMDPKRTPKAYEELTTYEYLRDKDGELTSDVPDANNHFSDATAYALDRLINNRHYVA